MAISLMQDVIPISEFKKNIKGTLAKMHKSGRPIVLTVNGKADAIIMGVENYEPSLPELELSRLVKESKDDNAAEWTPAARAASRVLASQKSNSRVTDR